MTPAESIPSLPESSAIISSAPRESSRPKTTLNLSGILKAPATKENQVVENKEPEPAKENRPVSLATLKDAWNSFAELRKDQVAEYHLLQQPFELKESHVTIHLTNPIEEPLLQSLKSQLVEYLRETLQNRSIQVSGIMKEFESKRFAYTNKEKFDQMVERNPALAELKSRFGLDPDF